MKHYIITQKNAKGRILKEKLFRRGYDHTTKDGFVYFHQQEGLSDFVDGIPAAKVYKIDEAKGPPDFPYVSIPI